MVFIRIVMVMGSEQLWFLSGSCSPLDRVLFAYCSPPGEGKAFKRHWKPL